MGAIKIQLFKWFVSWADLASGILGVLTLGYIRLDRLQLYAEHWYLSAIEDFWEEQYGRSN